MKHELEEKLREKFKFYKYGGFYGKGLPFECEDGWFKLLYDLSKKIQKLIDNKKISQDFNVHQVKEKFGCYDEETEILTEKGWKFFKNLKNTDLIATLNKNNFLEYQSILDYIEYDYCGEMYKLVTRGVDLLVTPNHNLYIAKPNKVNGRYKPNKITEHEFELTTYEKYYHKNKKFKKGTQWKGTYLKSIIIPGYKYSNFMKIRNKNRTYTVNDLIFNTNDFLNFLGWYVAEGCSDNKGNISIACCNVDEGKEKEIISNVISKLGFKIKTSMEDKSALIFRIYSVQLARWLSDNFGHKALEKKVPPFIKELPPKQIKIFLDSLYAGDGHKTKTAHILYTVSKQLSDDVQELILKCQGSFRETILSPKKTIYVGTGVNKVYTINWLSKPFHNTQEKGLSKNSFEGIVNYNGKVYCVEVSNHIIYVRRNGKGIWCGNSIRYYTNFSTDELDDLISQAEEQSMVTCEQCSQPGEIRDIGGHWYATLCDNCFNRIKKERNLI